MLTATTFIPPATPVSVKSTSTVVSPPARVRLRPDLDVARGFVDGGWWPRSWNLAGELPGLLAALFATGYHAHRVTYNLTARDPSPHTLPTDPWETDGGHILS